MPTLDEINALCREIAEETLEDEHNELAELLEDEHLAADPHYHGPDAGADDCDGLFYWDLK